MGKHYIYIMASSDKKHIHAGYCKDVPRMIRWYNEMPGMHFLFECYRQNVLVWLEEAKTLGEARIRFEQMMQMTMEQKIDLINSGNPGWLELVPGGNIDL